MDVSHAGGSRWTRSWLLALGFSVLGFLYLTVAGIDSSVTVDDVFYQLPVTTLRTEGEWSFDYVLSEVDPDGVAVQWMSAPSENGVFTNVRRPLWVLALVGADFVGGIPGQRLFVLASGGAAVLVASGLYRQVAVSARHAWVAAALTALSPLAFNAVQFWAHAPTAAITGFVMWMSLRAMNAKRRVPPLTFALATVGAALAPAIRTDGTIYMSAIAFVAGLSGVKHRRWDVAAYGGALLAVSAISHTLTTYARTWITGGAVESTTGSVTRTLLTRGSTSVGSRIEAFIETFVSGHWQSDVAYVLLLVSVLVTAYSVVLLRRKQGKEAGVLIAIAAAAWMLRTALAPEDFATGLLGAWPVALLVLAEPISSRTPAERQVMAFLGLSFIGVAATQYDVGGGLNWGGRFLSATIPGLAVLIASTLHRLPMKRGFGLLQPAVLGLAAVVTVGSIAADWTTRTSHDEQVRVLEHADPAYPVVTSSAALPNVAWRVYPDIQFVWIRDENQADVTEMLLEAGFRSVVGYMLAEEHAETLTGSPLRGDLWEPVTLPLRVP